MSAADVKPEATSPAAGVTSPAPAAAAAAPAAAAATPAASASLYVGELDPSVTEAMLFEIFNMIGPVASIRVCRDAVTRRSLGYAYVNYLNAADGERALEHLNYSLIKNRACRIMWSQRDPALRKTGQGNVFIKNLDEGIDNKALHDTFAAFGHVLSCKVGVDENGNSRGFGFVHYETGEAADAAIKAVNGMLLNDKKVYVGRHVSKKERLSKVEEQRAQFTNIYVKNVDTEVSQEDFTALFSPFGPIVSCVLAVDPESNASKGFGFVNYEKHEDARKAVDELNDKDFHGKKLFVSRAQKRSERDEELRRSHEEKKQEQESKTAGVNLYVKNLDDEWDDDRLRAEFDAFGVITSSKVMKDDKEVSRGFGFVCFSSPDEATKAVQEMNGKMIGTKPLYVSIAQRKEVRRQALESQLAQRNNQRMQYAAANGMGGPAGYMSAQPMYYPPMGAPYGPGGQMPRGMPGQPMGYPQGMMPARPRYGPAGGQPGMPMAGMPAPYGMAPPNGGMPYPPNYPRGNGARPPPAGAPRPNGGPSPVGLPSGLPAQGQQPRGSMPSRPQGYADAQQAQQPQKLNAQALARAGPNEQKQMLGEAIYPLIFESQPELAGKITGMLLEMDNAELLHLVENSAALTDKVNEALRVLNEWSEKAEDKPAADEAKPEATEDKAEVKAETEVKAEDKE